MYLLSCGDITTWGSLQLNQQIYTIFTCHEKSFIVFKNGAVSLLQDAIERRKELTVENVLDVESEFIYEVLYASFNDVIYIGLIVRNKDDYFLYWTKFVQDSQDKFYKVFLKRDKATLSGYVIHVDKFSVNFLSLCKLL